MSSCLGQHHDVSHHLTHRLALGDTRVSDPTFAEQVRDRRVAARLTQAELAERAGVSERAISDIERGLRARVYPVTARALADALALTDAARATFERAAQAGRTTRDRRPPPGGAGSGPTLADGDWRAIRRAPMFGRADEIDSLLTSLRDDGPRLHTITGPGGIGKSRLAAEVCAGYGDGVTWVSLAAVEQPELVLPTVAVAGGLPADAPLSVVSAALEDATALLVLDTFEPVLAAANDVAALVDLTTRMRVLVTSRAPLRVRGERTLPLRPLPLTAAIELFRQRARAVRPDLVADDEDAATVIEDISRRLSGLPLALELAAAKVRHMSLQALRRRLDRPLRVLDDGERDLPVRQQTMRAAIGWSYDLLPPLEQTVFRRLATFIDGWTLEAAETVCAGVEAPASAMLSTVGHLCEHGLIQVDATAVERWRLLDPIRDYALEQLDVAGERTAVEHRHAQVFAELAERAAPLLLGAEQTAIRDELRADVGNLRLALVRAIAAGDADLATRIAGSIWMFWRMEGALAEGRRWLQRALEQHGADASPYRSPALWGAAWLAYQQSDLAPATAYGTELLARSVGDNAVLDRRNALTILGHVAMAEGRFADAVGLLEEALDLARAAGVRWHVATSLLNLGTALLHGADPVRAQQLLEEAVAGHVVAGDHAFTARSTVEVGYAALLRGDLPRARSCFADALLAFLELRERWGQAEAVAGFAVLAAVDDDAETAAVLKGASETAYAEIASQINASEAKLGAPFLAHARTTLGESGWTAAVARGRRLAIEEAAQIALNPVRE